MISHSEDFNFTAFPIKQTSAREVLGVAKNLALSLSVNAFFSENSFNFVTGVVGKRNVTIVVYVFSLNVLLCGTLSLSALLEINFAFRLVTWKRELRHIVNIW